MKQKTHSGAKKRFRVKSRDKIKRKQQGLRHILSNKSAKRKRQLGPKKYVDQANLDNIQKCLNL